MNVLFISKSISLTAALQEPGAQRVTRVLHLFLHNIPYSWAPHALTLYESV